MRFRGFASIVLVGLGHAVLTLALSVYAFTAAMERMDGHPAPSEWQGAVQLGAGVMAQVLVMPADALYQSLAPGQKLPGVEWALFALNSLLWGTVLSALWRRMHRLRTRPAH